MDHDNGDTAAFGRVIGVAPGGVEAYSSDYDSADERELPNRQAYLSYVDGHYMGHKWQCVEFARRWLYSNKGYVFDDVAMAYDIFRLTSVREIATDARLPLRSFANGSKRWPEAGCLMIWDEGGEFEMTGHVAIVTEATPEYVRLAEQNVDNRIWLDGRDFSREIRAQVTEQGEYWVECSFGDATILGWVLQTGEDAHAERIVEPDRTLFNLDAREAPGDPDPAKSWLNVANPDEAAYVASMGGHTLASDSADQRRYYALSETALSEIKRAANELHALFMHATDYVLRDDERLARFNIPRAIWPRIHQSWDNRRNQMVTGRFDFSVSERGIKVYEYNCDSASCHMEAGKVQGKWAQHFDCHEGRDPGEKLFERLRAAWKDSDVGDLLHILRDDDPEETYHALFMQEAAEAAGLRTKVLSGFDGLAWDASGDVRDADGERVAWVWKTWAWETALDQIRDEIEDDEVALRAGVVGAARGGPPRLVDVLLRPGVMVYEPLWTLIPSNKAILPVLWSMFPDYPYLLNTSYELTDDLRRSGFVAKPIVGRGGANIALVSGNDEILEETAGGFNDRDQIYQELFGLPSVGGYNVQVNAFTAAGKYAGSCVRADTSLVINADSDTLPLRVVEDGR